jgi:hypothetical protein
MSIDGYALNKTNLTIFFLAIMISLNIVAKEAKSIQVVLPILEILKTFFPFSDQLQRT